MGFYGPEPFESAEATYVWTGLREPGFFHVTVSGRAPNYTTGIQLVRDPHFVGGLAVDVMGWTGPLGEGTKAYTVAKAFPGQYLKEIVIVGSNKRMVIPVREIPYTNDDGYVNATAALAPPRNDVPIALLAQEGKITLPLLGRPPLPGGPVWTAESSNAAIATAQLQAPPSVGPIQNTWTLTVAAKAPGTASVLVRQTQATTPPGTVLDEFTIAVTSYVL
jgi:hypothetical protein